MYLMEGTYRGVAVHKGRDVSWEGIQVSQRVTGTEDFRSQQREHRE